MYKSTWLQTFVEVYTELGTDNLDSLNRVYHPDVQFIDPIHQVNDRKTLLNYVNQLYSQIISCGFVIDHTFESGQEATVYWTMTLSHNKLNGKKPFVVQGHSHIKGREDKVIYHRDYLDLGSMVYEHIPLLGLIIRTIKKGMASA